MRIESSVPFSKATPVLQGSVHFNCATDLGDSDSAGLVWGGESEFRL